MRQYRTGVLFVHPGTTHDGTGGRVRSGGAGAHHAAMQLRRLIRLALATVLATLVMGQVAVVQATTPTMLLPDLTMLPPTDFKIEYTADGRKLLRFSTVAVNIGPGPFQVVGSDPIDGPRSAFQATSTGKAGRR